MKIQPIIILFFISSINFAQTLPKIDSIISKELESDKVAALAVAIIASGKIVHISAKGFSDLERKNHATIHTPFHVASISKTVTNLAIFKLVESAKIDVDTDINNYLPFQVTNPYYPNTIITVGNLLNHRSGIKDDSKIYGPFWNNPKGDPTIELAVFLKDYLTVGGKYYKQDHFESNQDHNSFLYSNTGVALLGLIVEHVSGMSYEVFCQENIFKPIGMINTSWFLKNLDTSKVAKTYVYKDATGLTFRGHNGYPDYPGGQLRTSINDFSKLWEAYLNSENGEFILTSTTTNKITPNPKTSQEGFYTWFLTALSGNLYYSHNGGDTGARTTILLDVYNKNGIIIFANTEIKLNSIVRRIENEMWSK
jgi:CubicO group peptidase (beta-lactamase class C family)